jgi:hypothetical protein
MHGASTYIIEEKGGDLSEISYIGTYTNKDTKYCS